MRILSSLLLTLFLLYSCSDNDGNDSFFGNGVPNAVTKEAQVNNESGAILNGDFTNFSSGDIIGFNVFLEGRLVCSLKITAPKSGLNSMSLDVGLYNGKTYEYQAFIETSSETYFGLKQSFVSQGSKAVSITEWSKTTGYFSDEIELLLDRDDIKVARYDDFEILFNGEPAHRLSIDGNKVTLQVPYFDGDSNATISINNFGNMLTTPHTFSLITPVVNQVTPALVGLGEELTITGDHFENSNREYVSVFVDGFESNVISHSRTEIKIRIPFDVQRLNPKIRVISQLQEASQDNAITIKSPVILEYPTDGLTETSILVKAENLHPVYYKNKVYFDGVEATVNEAVMEGYLGVQVPNGPYEDWNPEMIIAISDEIKSEPRPFPLNEYSIKVKEEVNVSINGYLILNNQTIVYGLENSSTLVIHKFSEQNYTFYDRMEIDLPSGDFARIINFQDGNLYVLFNREADNFYKVNIVTGIITKLTNAPGDKGLPVTVTIQGDNLILGGILGGNYSSSYGEIDSYNYSITQDTWSELLAFNNPPVFKAFYAKEDNESYFLQGIYSVVRDIYKFNGSEFVISPIEIPSGDFKDYLHKSYFFEEGKFYFIEDSARIQPNRMMILDITSYEWREIERILPRDYPITGYFKIGTNLYLQIIDYQYKYHLFKFDMTKLND